MVTRGPAPLLWLACLAAVLSACGSASPGRPGARTAAARTAAALTAAARTATTGTGKRSRTPSRGPSGSGAHRGAAASTPAARRSAQVTHGPAVLPSPRPLAPFRAAGRRQGVWHPAGRRVLGRVAVEETTLIPPGGSQPAGLAWMDTRLLAARLYSGSESPGGGPYHFTAPIEPAQAEHLVAAFNGGFQMNAAEGGYLTEGHTVVPLRRGAASLVISTGGSVALGTWGREVRMSGRVVAVRQNLTLLVDGGHLTPLARSSDWQAWGATCGASSCASSVPGIEHQWRSGLGITATGALVYAEGPGLAPAQLADLLVRAGAQRAMELDINPDWPIFATYDPPRGRGAAAAANGRVLLPGVRGADTFFEGWWARDFVTMPARSRARG